MEKKFLSCLICSLVVIFLLPTVAYADIGPKPSVTINFDGIKNDVYYITLLSKEKGTGPYLFSTNPIDENSFLVKENKQDDLKAWQAFRNYNDIDEFYFIEYFERCNDENTFRWGYYPPDIFKILIYFPQDNTFAISGIQEKYAFDSYYNVSVSENHTELNVKTHYDYSSEIYSLIARIIATVAIEVLIALLFGLRNITLLSIVIAVNFVTQIVLNVLLNIINYSSGSLAFVMNYVWMELLVIVIEAVIFSICFKKIKTDKHINAWIAPVYAVSANIASFAIGLLIAIKIPGVF